MTRQTITTPVKQSWHGEKYIETTIALPELGENRFLLITTQKRSDGKLKTTARACIIEQKDTYYTETYLPFTDFNKILISEQKRCTVKAIQAQHQSALLHAAMWVEQSLAHYSKGVAA